MEDYSNENTAYQNEDDRQLDMDSDVSDEEDDGGEESSEISSESSGSEGEDFDNVDLKNFDLEKLNPETQAKIMQLLKSEYANKSCSMILVVFLL